MAGRGRPSSKRRGGSFGQRKMKMKLDSATEARLKSEGLRFRWVNDDEGRLDEAYQGDYDFLTADGTEQIGIEATDKGRRMRKLVGKHKDGTPKYAYGMVIKEQYYQENQDKKEEVNKMVDEAIKGGTAPGTKKHGVDPSHGSTNIKEMNYNP